MEKFKLNFLLTMAILSFISMGICFSECTENLLLLFPAIVSLASTAVYAYTYVKEKTKVQ